VNIASCALGYLEALPAMESEERDQVTPTPVLASYKAQVIQSRKAYIEGQHHPEQELVDRHDSRDARDSQGFFYQLLKAQFL